MKPRTFIYSAIALGALALPAAAVAHAVPRSHTVPLAPNAMFGGKVNGMTAHATIRVACFGPVYPGKTGHPMAGQRVGVFIPEVMQQPTFGRTGSPARAIVVSITTGQHRIGPFTRFTRLVLTHPVISASRGLPTGLTVPCSGAGTVVFTPLPRTADAKPATVDVTFASQP